MDFIPNHTGKQSQWFLNSQKKEGKYTDYYIWTTCNPQTYRDDLVLFLQYEASLYEGFNHHFNNFINLQSFFSR